MAAQEEQQPPLHILFFPFLAPGHLITIADMAALFAARGVRCTILTTPVNAAIIRSAVDRANDAFAGPAIDISVVPFPDVGLPPGVENGMALTSQGDRDKFAQAVQLLREPFEHFLAHNHPDAVVTGSYFHWSQHVRAVLQRDHVAQQPIGDCPRRSRRLRRSQMMDPVKQADHWAFFQSVNAADQRSFGEVFNSFHELEPDYVEHYHTTLGRRAWLVGPVALASQDIARRGTDALSPDSDNCLGWLNTKPAGSVVYVSFGTLIRFSPAELHQLARGLELSGINFMWVTGAAGPDPSEWMPEGFAELMARGDRGFIIRGWAPQLLILNHPAVGGFVTHCGWNSTLEAVSAGVPMVTWPRYADQFSNEKLIVEVLKVGVSIGAKEYASSVETHEVIGGEVIAESIGRLMSNNEEGSAIRKKAKDLGVNARTAVESGGSSYNDVGQLMDELTARRSSMKVGEM
ncbi:hypothetical protein VPH35_031397 [Triticum aestivum]